VVFQQDQPFALLAFTVVDRRAVAIDLFAEPDLVGRLDLHAVGG
jgi:hypothetical protein